MSDEMDAMMADGLLHTVRECAHRLYGENNIYPCDDVKRMTDEIERFKLSLADVVMQTQEQAQEIKKLRADYETARDAHDRRMAEVVRLRAALREIKELPGELNPSNYDHDDVCACNNALVEAWNIASAALAAPSGALEDRT